MADPLQPRRKSDTEVVLRALFSVGIFAAVLCGGLFFFVASVCKNMKF